MSLEALDLTVEREHRRLLDGVSLTLQPGEILVVVGPNGAGKSTLLRCLAGELNPSQGKVALNARSLHHWRAQALARQRAVLPQSSPLNFPFSALEVAMMGRIPFGGPHQRDMPIALEALALAEVDHLAARRYTTLSGGERQRVQLARVLVQLWGSADSPRYLLLDEPTASLDLAHQHTTLSLAQHCRQRNIGVLVILHDLNLAAQYADRIAVLQGGQLLEVNTPRQVLDPTLLQRVFGLPVQVIPHPTLDCPLVVPLPGGVDHQPPMRPSFPHHLTGAVL